MSRTHAQSISNTGLSLACKAGKTQSYFFESKWRHWLRERAAELHGVRARTSDRALNTAKYFGVWNAATLLIRYTKFNLNMFHTKVKSPHILGDSNYTMLVFILDTILRRVK